MTNSLIITITNPDLLAELNRYGDPPDQQRIAEAALRIGLRALRHARGEVDTNSLQQTAEHILAQLEQHVQQHLATHSQHLLQQFSLDHDGSALNRLAKQQHEQYEKISTLFTETMTRKQVLRKTTQGGMTFEEAVGILVSEIAGRAGDHCDATGMLEGKLSKSKVGDFVITLGNDCAAAGERVVTPAVTHHPCIPSWGGDGNTYHEGHEEREGGRGADTGKTHRTYIRALKHGVLPHGK